MAYPDRPQPTPPSVEIGEIHASTSYIGPVISADGSGNGMEIARAGGNGDWRFLITRPDVHMTGIRFPAGDGGDTSLFVGEEFGEMFDRFLGRPVTYEQYPEGDSVYTTDGSYRIGTEEDDFEVEVIGIEGMGHYGEDFAHIQRFLDIRVNKDRSVVITLRNRIGNKDATEPSTQEEIDKMPIVTASVVLGTDDESSVFAESFAKIARRAAAAMLREDELFADWDENEEVEAELSE